MVRYLGIRSLDSKGSDKKAKHSVFVMYFKNVIFVTKTWKYGIIVEKFGNMALLT